MRWTAILLILTACGAGDFGPQSRGIGGSCVSDGDCERTCIHSNSFPRGMCTTVCATDSDCPSGSPCVADPWGGGFLCAVPCDTNSDCIGFGAGYRCESFSKPHYGGPEERANVCAVP